MKIFYFITGLGIGGAEKQTIAIAEQMAGQGHDVTLCWMTGSVLLKSSHKIALVPLKLTRNPISLIKGLFKFIKLLRQLKPDVVHSHMVHANLFARVMQLFLGRVKPVLICTAHSKNEGSWLRMLVYRLTDAIPDISTNVSQDAVDTFVALKASTPERMIFVPNGIDIETFTFNLQERNRIRQEWDIKPDTKVLIAVGRLAEAKDYPNLLRAYAQINQQETLLWIVGAGDSQALNEQAATLGIDKNVHFLGARHDISSWLSAADIFVLSSAWEGMPLVIAEAMANGKLIVATDCGGVKEMLADTGYLVPKQQPEALAQAIQEAIQLPVSQATEITQKAQQRVKMYYNIQRIVQQWLTLYNKLLKQRQKKK